MMMLRPSRVTTRGYNVIMRTFEPECSSTIARVLVIDDDASVGAAIQMMLDREGCDTVHAPDADVGIKAFESSSFDLVMVDLFMPGMNGLGIIAVFRQWAPTLPILAVSGFRFRDTMDPGLDFLGMAASAGATVCLRKPFSPRQLMAAVHASRDPTLLDDRPVGNREARQGPLG
jgi:DNA-binding response OmpR family regulator